MAISSPKRTKSSTRKLFPSKSYKRFEGVINRSLNLLALQQPLEKLFITGGKQQDLSDMTRAAVVLAVAAMDAYFTGVFAERFVPYLKKKKTPPKALSDLLEKAGLDTTAALQLLGMDRPYRRVRTLLDSYLAQHVTQRIEVVNELFLAYGLKDFSKHVQSRAKNSKLLSSIRSIVERRHKIVHKGDLNSHGKIQGIKASEIRKRVMHIVKFVSAADEILQNQMA